MTQGRRVVNAIHDPVMSILLAFWFTTTLEELVDQVDRMTEPVANRWPIGQISAILGLIVVAIEAWEYVKGKGPTNDTILRYQLWWSQSKTLFAIIQTDLEKSRAWWSKSEPGFKLLGAL